MARAGLGSVQDVQLSVGVVRAGSRLPGVNVNLSGRHRVSLHGHQRTQLLAASVRVRGRRRCCLSRLWLLVWLQGLPGARLCVGAGRWWGECVWGEGLGVWWEQVCFQTARMHAEAHAQHMQHSRLQHHEHARIYTE